MENAVTLVFLVSPIQYANTHTHTHSLPTPSRSPLRSHSLSASQSLWRPRRASAGPQGDHLGCSTAACLCAARRYHPARRASLAQSTVLRAAAPRSFPANVVAVVFCASVADADALGRVQGPCSPSHRCARFCCSCASRLIYLCRYF